MENRNVRSIAPEIGLFLIVTMLANTVIAWSNLASEDLTSTWYMVFYVHVWFTLYDGSFGKWRKRSWVLLILCWTAMEVGSLIGYILPWGQISYWLAYQMPWLEPVASYFDDTETLTEWLSLLIPALVLGFDIVLMQSARWRQRSYRKIGMLLIAACATAVIIGWGTAWLVGGHISSQGGQASYQSLPPIVVLSWHELWLLSLLRAMPSKLLGGIVALSALLVLAIWPWARADRLHDGQFRRLWLLLCCGLALAWVCLTFQGSQLPNEVTNRGVVALAIYYFAFFLALPFVLRRMMEKEPVSLS